VVVVGPRNVPLDRNALGVRLDVTDVDDAFGTPKEAEELPRRDGDH
jgi:hypothetical protein